MNKLFLFLINLNIIGMAQAQIDFKGQVIDNSTKDVIGDVQVELQLPIGKSTYASTKAQDGYFYFQNAPIGKHNLIFKKNGYKTKQQETQMTSGNVVVFLLEKKVPQPIPKPIPQIFLLEVVENNDVKTFISKVDIWLDSTYIGVTGKEALSLSVPEGKGKNFKIRCEKDGYNIAIKSFDKSLTKKIIKMHTFEAVWKNFHQQMDSLHKSIDMPWIVQKKIMRTILDQFDEIQQNTYKGKQQDAQNFMNDWKKTMEYFSQIVPSSPQEEKEIVNKYFKILSKKIRDFSKTEPTDVELPDKIDIFFSEAMIYLKRKWFLMNPQELTSEVKKTDVKILLHLLQTELKTLKENENDFKIDDLNKKYENSIEKNIKQLNTLLGIDGIYTKSNIGA